MVLQAARSRISLGGGEHSESLCCHLDQDVWRFILCVKLTRSRGADTWSNIILGVSVKVFWMGLAFESVDWVEQIALPKVGRLILSTEDVNRTEKLRGNSSHLTVELWHQYSPVLRLELAPSVFLVLKPLDLDWNYTTGWFRPLACRLQILKLLSLHNHMRQFLIIKPLAVYLSIYHLSIPAHLPILRVQSVSLSLSQCMFSQSIYYTTPSKCSNGQINERNTR